MVKSKVSMTAAGRGVSAILSADAELQADGRSARFEQFMDKYSDPEDAGLELIPLEVTQRLRQEGLNTNTIFQVWLDDNDDYGQARVVSNAELDGLIDSGATLLTRGMPDSQRTTGMQKLSQVMSGAKYYTGNGFYGDGLYFADTVNVAGSYATGNANNRGALMRAVLASDSRSIGYDDLYRMAKNAYPNRVMSDGALSCYARSLGYDVVTIPRSNGATYYNVLNRRKLVIASELGSVRGTTITFSDEVRNVR